MTSIALLATTSLASQNQLDIMRTIEVTGQSEQNIDPDEIIFTITIEEYWKEEFEGKKYKDYRTKIEIEGIEQSLISELKSLGIGMDQITLRQAGNYWRARGKDFLVNKTMDIKLDDFSKANEIANKVQTRGVRNMHVSQLKHRDIKKYKLDVKVAAVSAARAKAEALAAAMGKKVKDVVSIVEIDQYAHIRPQMKNAGYARAADMAMAESGPSGVEYENYKKIKVAASVRAVFEME